MIEQDKRDTRKHLPSDVEEVSDKHYATRKQQIFEKYQSQGANINSRSKLGKMEEKHNSMISEHLEKNIRISPRQQQAMTEKSSVNVSTVNNFSLANFKNSAQVNPGRSEKDTCASEMKIHDRFEPKNQGI